MNLTAMNAFLSETNIKKHLEYLKNLRLKYSILIKSIPELCEKEIYELPRLNIDRQAKQEAISLLWEIKSHELFFNSFIGDNLEHRERLYRKTSIDRLIYDIFSFAKDKCNCFIYCYNDERKCLKLKHSNVYDGAFIKYNPVLCIDLYEHCYFNDYGFKKESYLRSMLSWLDIYKLS